MNGSFNSLVGRATLSTTCTFPFFQKAKVFWLNYLCRFPFRIAVWRIYTRSIFSLVLLKIFWNFRTISRKKNPRRSSCSQVFSKISVLKKFVNFTRKHKCWSHFLIKPPKIKRLQHRCSPVNFAKLLRTL